MYSKKLIPRPQHNKKSGAKKSRNLKVKSNLFNPMSEFGLGVQVVKINKQLQLFQKAKNKKLSIKQQIYQQHEDILQKRSLLNQTSKNHKYLDSFLKRQQQEKKKLLRPHKAYQLVTSENSQINRNNDQQQTITQQMILFNKKNKSSLLRSNPLQQSKEKIEYMQRQAEMNPIISQKVILPKLDRSIHKLDSAEKNPHQDQFSHEKQNRNRSRNKYGKTVENFKIRKSYLTGQSKNEKFKKRRQMILRQKQLKNDKLYANFGQKMFPMANNQNNSPNLQPQNIAPKPRVQRVKHPFNPDQESGEMIKRINQLKNQYEQNVIKPIIPVVQKIYLVSQQIPQKQAQINKRQRANKSQLRGDIQNQQTQQILTVTNVQHQNQQWTRPIKQLPLKNPQSTQQAPVQPKKHIINSQIKKEDTSGQELLEQIKLIDVNTQKEVKQVKEMLKQKPPLPKQSPKKYKQKWSPEKMKKKVDKEKLNLNLNFEERKVEDNEEELLIGDFKPNITSLGFGSMNSARLEYARKKQDRKKKAKKKDKDEKEGPVIPKEIQFDLKGYAFADDEDQFNEDFELGDYMDAQKGIIYVDEEIKPEFFELDSSAEFHEWEKRQRAVTPDARIRKKTGDEF